MCTLGGRGQADRQRAPSVRVCNSLPLIYVTPFPTSQAIEVLPLKTPIGRMGHHREQEATVPGRASRRIGLGTGAAPGILQEQQGRVPFCRWGPPGPSHYPSHFRSGSGST